MKEVSCEEFKQYIPKVLNSQQEVVHFLQFLIRPKISKKRPSMYTPFPHDKSCPTIGKNGIMHKGC